MAFQLSPGVNVSEIDLTTIVPSLATSIGGFVGKFAWGPANEVVTISDELRLVERFFKPNSDNFEYWFTAANFLAYTNNLKLVRAIDTATSRNSTEYKLLDQLTVTTAGTGYSNGFITVVGETTNANVQIITSGGNIVSAIVVSDGNFLTAPTINVSSLGGSNAVITATVSSELIIENENDYNLNHSSGSGLYGTFAAKYAGNLGDALKVELVDGGDSGNAYANWTYAGFFGDTPATTSYTSARGGSNDEVHAVVIDVTGKISGTTNTVLETFAFMSKASDAKTEDGSSNYYVNVINNRSKYVWWLSHPVGGTNWGNTAEGTTFAELSAVAEARLTGGADSTISNDDITRGYDEFKNADTVDISLLLTGPANSTVANYIVSNIAEYRKDCVVFISPERADVVDNYGAEVTDILAFRNALNISSSYAFMDSNWKYQFDKYNDVYRWVPLNGDVAGLAARTDSERDPWWSPAGLNRGVIKNVIKLAWNPNKTDRDDLYTKGVNPVVSFQGEGVLLYGDKTLLGRPSAFDRVNVRRLFIVLEKAIAKAARSTLFEFNDQFTRAQFVALVEPYLRDVQGRRGIYDFRVVCDETNNTPEVIDRNEFVGDIYIKPARSINFIQLNFVAVRTGVLFDEIVGQV